MEEEIVKLEGLLLEQNINLSEAYRSLDVILIASTKLHEMLIKEVLTQLLNRQPIKDDYKYCIFVTQATTLDTYEFIYKATTLGRVHKIFTKDKIALRFDPVPVIKLTPSLR